MSEILKKNIEILNKKYKPATIQFVLDGDKIKIIDNFLISKQPTLKDSLKNEYSIIFDWNQKFWYIGKKTTKDLSKKIIKEKPDESISSMKSLLKRYTEKIKEIELKNSIKKFLEKHDFFFKAPASKYKHHNYEGGLLEHTIQTVRLALQVKNTTKNLIIDNDLIISGAILHDIGKINCYTFSNGLIETTDIYDKQYHIINGIKIISQEIESKKLDELIHIIASHHNIKEWGSPVEPMTNEAWIIHLVENLSARIMG